MKGKVSVVLNTLNEEKNLQRVLQSVRWADEVVVCDMHSEDGSVQVAKKLGAKVISHERVSFVEPARNFAIAKATGEWVLVLDPDEEVPSELASKLQEIAQGEAVDFVEIPRKNIIFGKWVKASMWWPDYNIRFFKKGKVSWSERIHRPPLTEGTGQKLPEEEKYALLHHHYESVSQFIKRMDRYSDIQADELFKDGVKFSWTDLIKKPLGEFLGRYFAKRGFEDGLHGLALALMQAVSFLVVYLKLWEMEKFPDSQIELSEVKQVAVDGGKEINYWFRYGNLSTDPVKRFWQKVKNKVS